MESNIPAGKDVPAGRDGRHHINYKEDRLPPILWPLALATSEPDMSQYTVITSPRGRSSDTRLGFFAITAVSILTGELWSTYEKWRFQLFAGPNPWTNNARVLSSVIQARSQRRELLSLIISSVCSSRYKHNRSRQMCVFYLRSKEHFRYIGRITFMNWLSSISENMNIDVQWRYYRILRSDYL